MGSARWFRLSLGAVLALLPLLVLFGRLDPIWAGHPAYPTALLVTVAGGLTLIALVLLPWRLEQEPDGLPWEVDQDTVKPARPASGRSHRGRRLAWQILASILVVGLVGLLAWLRPFPAGSDAIAAGQSSVAVTVSDNPTTIEMQAVGRPTPTVGLVFSPGARVDARGYTALLRPAAEAGYLIVILKEPFGLAITQPGQSAGPIDSHPEIAHWAVGGHSLGGVSAAAFAGEHLNRIDGLLLWASYPNNDLSAATSLAVSSIFGSNDLLATPSDIQRNKSKLPPQTTYVEISGGVHAYFADYGEQPGDGLPAVDRATASAQISAATIAFLGRVPN